RRVVLWVQRKPGFALMSAAFGLAIVLGFGAVLEAYFAQVKRREQAERRDYEASIPKAAQLLAEGNRDEAAKVLNQCPERFRGFEYDLLQTWCEPAGSLLPNAENAGLRAEVRAIAWHPHLNRVAVGYDDGTARLYDTLTRKQLYVLENRSKPD